MTAVLTDSLRGILLSWRVANAAVFVAGSEPRNEEVRCGVVRFDGFGVKIAYVPFHTGVCRRPLRRRQHRWGRLRWETNRETAARLGAQRR